MSLEAMRLWVETNVQTAMANAYPAIPVKYDNARFIQPETTWTSLRLIDGKSFGTNLGNHKVDRHVGLIQFDVLVPEHTGTSQANTIASFIGDFMKNRKIGLSDGSSVVLRQPEYKNIGRNEGFYRVMCRVPYWRDDPSS